MDHREAIEAMASERYLLDELSPEAREAYEEHLFSCTECATDAMLGAVFVDRAKAILPSMSTSTSTIASTTGSPALGVPTRFRRTDKRDWFAWLRPAVMVPAFTCLLCIIGYQNLVTYRALELAATEPRVLPAPTVLHGETRGVLPIVHADPTEGSSIAVELPEGTSYTTYKFDFYNSAGKLIWSRSIPSGGGTQDTQTIWLPGDIKQDTYKLALSGVTASGATVSIQEQFFNLQVEK